MAEVIRNTTTSSTSPPRGLRRARTSRKPHQTLRCCAVGRLTYYVIRLTVNARWRLTFRFAGGDAYGVAIEDYHKG